MNLSENFTLEELTFSQTAARKGIDNTPSPEIVENLKRLAGALEWIRSRLGKPVNVTSGYRSPAVNKAVGGAANSAHMSGLAADINVSGMTPKALALAISKMDHPFDQIILEYDNWVHVGLSNDKPRKELLTIRQGTGYMKGIA